VSRPTRALLLVAVAALAAGCGGASPAGTAVQSPERSIQLAAAHLQTESFRVTITATLTVDASNATGPFASALAAGAQQSGTQSIQEQVQDAAHISATVSAGKHTFHMVLYDGAVYVSVDGQNYKGAPFLSNLLEQFSTAQLRDYAAHLKGTKDDGTSTQGGIATEQYESTLDGTYLSSLLTKVMSSILGSFASSIPASFINSLVAAMHYQDITVNWYVDKATGRLVREVARGAISFDVGKFLSAMQGASGGTSAATSSGTMVLHENADAQLSGWGDKIVVSKPNATGTVTPQEFGQMLLAAPASQ
jgi:hypothetical protein